MISIDNIINPVILHNSNNIIESKTHIIKPLAAYRFAGQEIQVEAKVTVENIKNIEDLIVHLCLNDNPQRKFRYINMSFDVKDGLFKGNCKISEGIGGTFFYTVRFSVDKGKTWKYSEDRKGKQVYRNLIVGPNWFAKSSIYQIYPRIHRCRDKDRDGKIGECDLSTLVDIKEDLPRIKKLNIDTIWLMPIHPIGKLNRKGEFGSPYSVRDYLGIDHNIIRKEPGKTDKEIQELGKQQLQELVNTAHSMDMKIIIGFVGNHCASDNVLLNINNPKEKGGYHPEWFFMDKNGNPKPPYEEWWDTSDLKYGAGLDEVNKPKYSNEVDREAMWSFMLSVLKYWVTEFDIDGYRCDFAHWVPLAFWRSAINEVKAVKPSVIFIGEVYERLKEHLEVGFDAVYHYRLYNMLKSLYHEIRNYDPYHELAYIPALIKLEDRKYPDGYRLMRYSENHDEIRAAEMYGSADAAKAPTLLIVTLPGVPCIYAGQESGEVIRPPLFKGDRGSLDFPQIDFNRNPDLTSWYAKVLGIRRQNPALIYGNLEFMESNNRHILAYSRTYGDNRIIVSINFDYTDGSKQWANLKVANNLKIINDAAKKYRLRDLLNHEEYVYSGKQLSKELVVGLEMFKSHIFLVTEVG
ncbi:hypothetical protein GF312_14970 [Candidatus Poribacteria bacterium]|nr:hypothetical protein [Candidatus Poribacteria bacterium]